jgi:hypothetical protein
MTKGAAESDNDPIDTCKKCIISWDVLQKRYISIFFVDWSSLVSFNIANYSDLEDR